MTRTIDWDSIPDTLVVEEGIYEVSCEDIQETISREAQKLMYTVVMRVVEPKVQAGLPVYDRFVIGTDEDPMADNAETWKRALRLKKFVKASGVTLSSDIDATLAATKGKHFVIAVTKSVNDGKRDASRKGQPENRVTSYYGLGEREPAIGSIVKGTQAATPTRPTTAVPMEGTISCPICAQVVARAAYSAHATGHSE